MPKKLKNREQQMVLDFSRSFDMYYVSVPSPAPEHIADLRHRLLQEEVHELRKGFETGNIVEIADGIGDSLYILYGTALCYGLYLSVYTAYYVSYEWAADPIHDERMPFFIKAIEETVAVLYASKDRTLGYIEAHLRNLRYFLYEMARGFRLHLPRIFAEIHRSNMTKLGSDGKPVKRADGKLLKGEGYSPPNLAPIITEYWREIQYVPPGSLCGLEIA